MFESKAGAYPRGPKRCTTCSGYGLTPKQYTNLEGPVMTNTLAFKAHLHVTKKKSFVKLAKGHSSLFERYFYYQTSRSCFGIIS